MLVCQPCNSSFVHFPEFGSRGMDTHIAPKRRWQMYTTWWGAKALHTQSHEEWTKNHQRYIRIHSVLERIVWGRHHSTCSGYPRTIDCVLGSNSLSIASTQCQYIFMFDTRFLATKPSNNHGIWGHVLPYGDVREEFAADDHWLALLVIALLHHFLWLLIATNVIWSSYVLEIRSTLNRFG